MSNQTNTNAKRDELDDATCPPSQQQPQEPFELPYVFDVDDLDTTWLDQSLADMDWLEPLLEHGTSDSAIH